jgi:hypothetical protein
MTEMRCSRCSRLRDADEANDVARFIAVLAADGPPDPSVFAGQAPWASIAGAVVCPQCQTADERNDSARRIVAAVEAEITRAGTGGTGPTPAEAGMIAYVMHLRERLAQIAPESAPPVRKTAQVGPATGPADVGTKPAPVRFRVAITGAFLTGQPLLLPIGDYEQAQHDLAREFKRHPGQGWSVNTDQWRQEGTYQSGGGFTSMLPLVLARRDGPDTLTRMVTILNDRPEAEHDWLTQNTTGWTLTPTAIRIDLYDLGMAVMTGTFDVQYPPDHGLSETARLLKRLVWLKPDPDTGVVSPFSATFRALAEETSAQFTTVIAAAAPHTIQQPWLAPFLTALPPDASRATDWGRLLWLHPVHLLEISPDGDTGPDAAELAPPFHRMINVPDGRFVSGIGWSALVTNTPSADTDVPLKLLELHWAYIALYMEIDRGLLAVLDNHQRDQTGSLTQLEHRAADVFADYTRVELARARVESTLASLGGDEQAIWDVIADVTKFASLVEGVNRKVDILQRIAERRVEQAAATSARRTSAILGFLTALTIVTVALDLVGNFIGGRSDPLGHLPLRIATIILATLLGIGIYREAYRDPSQRRRRK